MHARKFSSSAATTPKQGIKRLVIARPPSREEAAMMREGEALLAKIHRGLDEAIARADRLLARLG